MARFYNVIIRTGERLDEMGPLGRILKTIGSERQRIELPDGPEEEVPLVYQFCKGERPGETANVSPDKIIGGVSNIHFNEDRDLVGDVRLAPMMRLSEHYQGEIDNLLVARTVPIEENSGIVEDGPSIYELRQLIVYDKFVKKANRRHDESASRVQKTYVAPQEVYGVDPMAGEKLASVVKQTDEELQKVFDNNTWKGHKVDS